MWSRYAIYYAPPTDAPWRISCTDWLGWNVETGQETRPTNPPANWDDITRTPRKYGLHGTLKPPFRLADGTSQNALEAACATLAAAQPQLHLGALRLRRLGRFLALCPTGDQGGLPALAAACVRDLDHFRAPALDGELTRRRAAGLSPRQEAHLLQWGYPHVMEDFTFHITLSTRLAKTQIDAVQTHLQAQLGPILPDPFRINDIALVGEAEDGRFHLIRRFALA
ncbi:MAG: DUF1045 domain-containing protein [Sedimentitalea sp.]